MSVTEHLKKEHETISRMLMILEMLCERIQSGEKVRGDDIERLFDGMGVFVYHCHHIKEKTILFPVLVELGLPEQHRSISEILEAHDTDHRYFEGLRWGFAHYRAGQRDVGFPLLSRAKRYISFLSQEIEQEDWILFPLVDAALSAEKEARIIKEFEYVEQERQRDGSGETVHQLLDELSQVYLHGMERRQEVRV